MSAMNGSPMAGAWHTRSSSALVCASLMVAPDTTAHAYKTSALAAVHPSPSTTPTALHTSLSLNMQLSLLRLLLAVALLCVSAVVAAPGTDTPALERRTLDGEPHSAQRLCCPC